MEIGGAERQIVGLAKGLKHGGWRVGVAVFYAGGTLEDDLTASGIEVLHLGKRGRWEFVRFVFRLAKTIRAWRPQTLYSFLAGANVVSALARPLFPPLRLIWSVRASDMDHSRYDRTARWVHALEARLSHRADIVIANSHAGAAYAIEQGFPQASMKEVPNGVDTARFAPDSLARARQRATWDIGSDSQLVGIMARLDPMKGHRVLLDAAARVVRRKPQTRFVCIGYGPKSFCEELVSRTRELGLEQHVLWAGASCEPVAALNALDLLCAPSIFGEGFSNAVSEAMACGIPCVVSDVGDSARIVSDLGAVVPAGDAAALADAIERMLETPHTPDRAGALRRRITENFSEAKMVARTEQLLLRDC